MPKIISIGNSTGVLISKEKMAQLGLKVGDMVEISVSKASEIFSEPIPVIQRTEEIRELFKQYPDLDRDYIASAAWADNRKRVEKNWKIFRPYADKDFLADLKNPKHFRGRLWEMELGCLLLSEGHTLMPKTKSAGPDFETKDFYIECIGARGGEGETALSPPIADGQMREVPHNKIKLRISNAFTAKRDQYRRWTAAGIIDASKPRIIAINLGGLGWWPMMERGEPSSVEEVLFGFGNEVVHIDRKTHAVTRTTRELAFEISKGKKAKIPVAFFNGKDCADIAAVISSEAMFVSPESLEVVHNPFAENPLNTKMFKKSKQMVWKPEGDGLTREVIKPETP